MSGKRKLRGRKCCEDCGMILPHGQTKVCTRCLKARTRMVDRVLGGVRFTLGGERR